jgi:hypothetical protein
MTVQTYIDRAMNQNNVDVYQYLPAQSIQDFNIIMHQIEDYITSAIWERFFWDILTVGTTIVDQSEYTLPEITTGNFNWTPKVEAISIQYTAWWDFIPARLKNLDILLQEHDLSWYETNVSESNPIFFIADDSYFIYPAPKTAIANAIKLYWIKSLSDVTATTALTDLFGGKIPSKYFYLISDWMKQFIKEMQGKDEESVNAKRIFELEKLPNLVEKLWNRKPWISQRGTPNLSKYK